VRSTVNFHPAAWHRARGFLANFQYVSTHGEQSEVIGVRREAELREKIARGVIQKPAARRP
jgi:hypothetical protein